MKDIKEVQKAIAVIEKHFNDKINEYKECLEAIEHQMKAYEVDSCHYESSRLIAYSNRIAIWDLNKECLRRVNELKVKGYDILTEGMK